MTAAIRRRAERASSRNLALALLATTQFVLILDIAIVTVALPSIGTDLDFAAADLTWVINAYALLFGGFLLLGGRMADLIGRRRMFMYGLILFTAASLAGALAQSALWLVIARGAQGLGAALVSPAALALVMTLFAQGAERNKALGIWGAVAGSGGAVGVLLGGILTSAFSWPWIFYVNVPVGAAVLLLSPLLLRESRADLPNRYFDFAGAATITSGLMLLVYGMTRATQHGWGTPSTISLLTASAVLIASFFLIESRTKAPLLPLRILRLRTLAGSNLSALIATAAVFSQFFLLTLYMQQVLHYSALKTGVAYIGLTVTTIALSAVAQGLVTRFGVRRVLPVGLALSTVALVLFAQLPVDGHYFWDLFPGFIISGLGLAFVFIPMSIGALTGVRPADAGIASGLINTSQQIGGAVGVAAATTIATTFTNRYVHSHAGTTAFSAPALTHGFQIAFYALAATAAVGAVIAAVLIEPQPAQAEPKPEADERQVAVVSQHTPVCRAPGVLVGELKAN
jgi:EmrB/QacA subfamily drug resistance transporter